MPKIASLRPRHLCTMGKDGFQRGEETELVMGNSQYIELQSIEELDIHVYVYNIKKNNKKQKFD